jgi:hypothetical protein
MEICSVVAGAVPVDGRTDRQTDMSNVIVPFWNFASAANNTRSFSYCYTNILTAKLKCSLLTTNSANGWDPNLIDNMLPHVL